MIQTEHFRQFLFLTQNMYLYFLFQICCHTRLNVTDCMYIYKLVLTATLLYTNFFRKRENFQWLITFPSSNIILSVKHSDSYAYIKFFTCYVFILERTNNSLQDERIREIFKKFYDEFNSAEVYGLLQHFEITGFEMY